jgi:PEP-CTERM motif
MLKNRDCGRFVAKVIFAVTASALLAGDFMPAHALEVTGINMFHDLRGPNDVGVTAGNRIQYGANIVGGSAGATLSAVYPPSGFSDAASPCGPLTTNANFCSNSVAFNANRLASPWNLTFTKGADSLTVAGPSMAGTAVTVPHPTSVTISGGGATPTISWTLPPGYTPDGLRVNIYDRDPAKVRANGNADIIHSVAVAPGATSYTLPAVLSAGGSLRLGASYAINFQVVETRGDVAFTNNNAQILSRSSSFFAFSPLAGGGPPNVHLPQINNGAFEFSIDSVGPNEVTFIDPDIAIGYSYATGAGDPNFASVILPSIGDDMFDLFFGGIHHALAAGVQYFFPVGGVSAFDVLGIETSAGLDPTDPLAFITGLTFVSQGRFTGTMTPISVNIAAVPEPGSFALLGLGLLAIRIARRSNASASGASGRDVQRA